MSITSMIMGALGGSAATIVAGFAAKKLVTMWAAYKGGVETGIEGAIKTIDTYFEDKWGIDLVDDEGTIVHDIITRAVAWVDKYAGSRDFWKLVIANIMTINPTKVNAYIAQLKGLDLAGSLKGLVEAELVDIVNQTKKEVAVKVIENKAVLANIKPIVDLDVKVDAAVVANKVSEPIVPVTQETLEKLIVESQKRQEALKK